MLYLSKGTFLNKIGIGETAIIEDCFLREKFRDRGLDFGIIKGTEISCVGKSALGDPKAYSISGTTFALRENDAEKIVVRCVE